MSFAPFTCPKIDENISNFQDYSKDFIRNLIVEVCPLLEDTPTLEFLVEERSKELYDNTEDLFENVRKTNEDLRDIAESLIQDKDAEISNLISSIEDLEKTIEGLE